MHLVLVRHGETRAEPGRCIGHTDVELSERGRAATRALAASWDVRSIPPPVRLVSSDLLRAHESAVPFAARFRRRPRHDPRLREMSFGEWEERLWGEIERSDATRFREWAERWSEIGPPGGESTAALLERARVSLGDALARTSACGSLLIVSHAGWIRAALTLLLNEPVSSMFAYQVDHSRATIVRLDPGERPEVVAWNTSVVRASNDTDARS